MGLLNQSAYQYYNGTTFGDYQFTSLDNIISQFIIAYVGEDKIISKIKAADVQFHAMRALQELSFDTFRSCKSQEIEVCPSLTMPLPQDYVNYVKLTWSDSSGVEHIIYPGIVTSNPLKVVQDDDCGYTYDEDFLITTNDSTTWNSYQSGTPDGSGDDYKDDSYWPIPGSRFGLDPKHAQGNGSYYIDCITGKIHFSSNLAGKTVILKYVSDSLGTDDEMVVHKFAEEAMYKWIAHAILATRANTPEYLVQRFKKERFAAIRTAKLRLSNIKLEEITQILRGKSKQIKH